MIVSRMIVKAKQGLTDELAELVSSEVAAQRKRGALSNACRIYTPNIGQSHMAVVIEWEWVDMAENDRFWSEWLQLPTTPEYFRKWDELVDPDWTNEIWNLRTA